VKDSKLDFPQPVYAPKDAPNVVVNRASAVKTALRD
jgi:hypothetical protein